MSNNKTHKISDLINQTAKETANEVIVELKRHGLIKSLHTPFQKTEQLLYNYNSFIDAVNSKQEMIDQIKEHGVAEKSKSVVIWSGNNGINTDTPSDKAEDKIESIVQSISVTKRLIKVVDDALDKIREDDYFDVIIYKYFEGKTHEDIACIYDKDVSTITRNKNRLVNRLKVALFSDEVIAEIFS